MKPLPAAVVLSLAVSSTACRGASSRGGETSAQAGAGSASAPASAGHAAAARPPSSRPLDAPRLPWPDDAPDPAACQTHADCAVEAWSVPLPPDPCCDQPAGYQALARSYLRFMASYRKAHCGGARCPSLPLPGAEPACCASVGRCVAKRCVTACGDPTARAPSVSALDPQCDGFKMRPDSLDP